MLDANSIAALLPPPQNQSLGNAPPVVDAQRVTFPTTGEYLNYDAATLPPGQEPTWTPAPPSTTAAPTPTVPPTGKTVIDMRTTTASSSSSMLLIGVIALIVCLLMAGAFWFLGNRSRAASTTATDFSY